MGIVKKSNVSKNLGNEKIQLAWHYTTGEKFYSIVESGVLIPTAINIDPAELPILWFSMNQVWEPTSRKMIRLQNGKFHILSKKETAKYGGGLVRFGYRPDRLFDWNILPAFARISSAKALQLETAGKAQGANPSDWMGIASVLSVPDLVIDVMAKNGTWERVQSPEDQASH